MKRDIYEAKNLTEAQEDADRYRRRIETRKNPDPGWLEDTKKHLAEAEALVRIYQGKTRGTT